MSEEYQKTTEAEMALLEMVQNKRFLDLERVPLICKDIADIKNMMEEDRDARKNLVTQDQFWPVKTLVYGFVGLILVAVVSALVALVIKL